MAIVQDFGGVAPAAPPSARAKVPGIARPAVFVIAIVVLGLFLPQVVKSSFYLGLLINAIVLGIAPALFILGLPVAIDTFF